MLRGLANIILVFILAEIATALILNESLTEGYENRLKENNLTGIKTRRNKGKSQSTSSDEKRAGEGSDGKTDDGESLLQSFSESSSTDTDEKDIRVKKDRMPKSSAERKGWRKWHRKCPPCREEMRKKWRDPTIKWICGAYQRARRTFKSLCMMHYRNCQDGTMFTKIADHRCPNGTGQIRPYNIHFFYDYNVVLTEDSSGSGTPATSSEEKESSSWSELDKLTPIHI